MDRTDDLVDFPLFEGDASTTGFEGGVSATAYSSPALQSLFGFSSSASGSTTNMGTVSPQDLLIHSPFMSAPNSTTFTALTSPSVYDESPDMGGSFASPFLESGDFDTGSAHYSGPLFPPPVNVGPQASQKPASAEQSAASKSDDREVAAALHRRKSSGTSPTSSRPSSVAGVGSGRRDKPLPDIKVDENDPVAVKRARNTLAARKSRARKAQRLEELEEQIKQLTAERDHWKNLALDHGAALE